MKRFFIWITIALGIAFCGSATANESVVLPSSGELSPVLSCFYECKPGPTVRGIPTWQEVTNLAVLNADTGLKEYQYSFDPRDPLDQFLVNVNADLTDLWTLNLDSISTAEGSGPARVVPPAGAICRYA